MTMDRRRFLKWAGLIAGGVIAADQLDILARLGWRRRFFPSAAITPPPYREYRVGSMDIASANHFGGWRAGPAGPAVFRSLEDICLITAANRAQLRRATDNAVIVMLSAPTLIGRAAVSWAEYDSPTSYTALRWGLIDTEYGVINGCRP